MWVQGPNSENVGCELACFPMWVPVGQLVAAAGVFAMLQLLYV